MSKLITNFLTTQPMKLGFFRLGIAISQQRLDAVKPNLYNNLKQACTSYVDGLLDLDEEYIKNTSSPYLYQQIQPEIKELMQQTESPNSPMKQFAKVLQNSNVVPAFNPPPQNKDNQKKDLSRFHMVVFPYVIFGQKPTEAIKQISLNNTFQITRNRFLIKKQQQLGIGNYVGKLFSIQTYGFRCFFLSSQRNIVITFEGNIQTDQYFVVDLNNQLQANKYN